MYVMIVKESGLIVMYNNYNTSNKKIHRVRYLLLRQLNILNIVIPAKAGIQEGTGCRIKSGMTELDYSSCQWTSLKKHPF